MTELALTTKHRQLQLADRPVSRGEIECASSLDVLEDPYRSGLVFVRGDYYAARESGRDVLQQSGTDERLMDIDEIHEAARRLYEMTADLPEMMERRARLDNEIGRLNREVAMLRRAIPGRDTKH